MVTFNLANTDDRAHHVELILATGAIQRLLGCQDTRAHELADRFADGFVPRRNVARDECARLQNRTARANSPSVRDAWIRDLYALRGALAHGRVTAGYQPAWNIREHLLLTSYAFPLLMKARLARVNHYTLTEDDQLGIDAFEPLACVYPFQPPDAERGIWPWNEIVRRVADDALRARAIARLEELDTGVP